MPRPNVTERNRVLATELTAATTPEAKRALMAKYGLSYSHLYRSAQAGRKAEPETFAAKSSTGRTGSGVGGSLFGEVASSGLRYSGGRVDDDYDRRFRSFSKRMQLYREMGDDPIVAAVLQAIRMLLRKVAWSVELAGETKADEQAAEFLDSCLYDMSQSWSDTVDQALGAVQYGFSVGELVYKKRNGPAKSQDMPGSNYDDGRIGWRKWTFLAPESLASGDEWQFDEHGGIQAIHQSAPPDYRLITLPIEKAILFRTTAEKNNPEGRSILRAMWSSYWMKRNLEEIEAISAERMGTGFPVVYLGSDVAKNPNDSGGDLPVFKDIVRNVRVDEQMGIVIPYAKMGAGAAEGKGVLFELMSPPSRGAVDFHQTITRHSQHMAMVGLAQFVHLGMNQVGARALGESSTDFFTLAIEAWADMLSETINRYAVERLFRLNTFPGATGTPVLAHEPVGRQSLTEVADYITKLAGAGVIGPDAELEKYLRTLGDLPEKAVDVNIQTGGTPVRTPPVAPEAAKVEAVTADAPAETTVPKADTEGGQGGAEGMAETFALRGEGLRGRKPANIAAVNTYQKELERAYAQWADDLANELADAEDDNQRDELIAAAVAALLILLRNAGRASLPEAVALGLKGAPMSPAIAQKLADSILANDGYIENSLTPAILAKLRATLSDPDVLAAIAAGAGAAAIAGALAALGGRVAQYAGEFWKLYNQAVGEAAVVSADPEHPQGQPVIAYLDPQANHCGDCPQFHSVEGTVYESFFAYTDATGGRVPGMFECGNGCRCWLESESGDMLSERARAERFYDDSQPRDADGKFAGGGGGGESGATVKTTQTREEAEQASHDREVTQHNIMTEKEWQVAHDVTAPRSDREEMFRRREATIKAMQTRTSNGKSVRAEVDQLIAEGYTTLRVGKGGRSYLENGKGGDVPMKDTTIKEYAKVALARLAGS